MAKGYNTVPFGFERVDDLPFLKNELFDSYDAANTYAATDPTAYAGQRIAVVDATSGEAKSYTIQPGEPKTLKEDGGTVEWLGI